VKKCATNVFNFVHLALKLYLHYLVKFGSLISAVYNSGWLVVSDELLTVPYDPLVHVQCLLCHSTVFMWIIK